MRLISWNIANRSGRAAQQAAALLDRSPDVVALQEVTRASYQTLVKGLEAGGLNHSVSAVPMEVTDSKARSLGVMIASRFPLCERRGGFTLPWPEKGISAIVQSPFGQVEINTVHVPPGSSNGWVKIRVFEAIFASLRRYASTHRVLCGDFNSPQAELVNGEVICWGKRLCKDGHWRLSRLRRGGSAEEWEKAEASVLVNLRESDLSDVFRALHGYQVPAFSVEMRHGSTTTRRRFDHILANASLRPVSCEYLHDYRLRGLSDHAPIEAVFTVCLK